MGWPSHLSAAPATAMKDLSGTRHGRAPGSQYPHAAAHATNAFVELVLKLEENHEKGTLSVFFMIFL